jgi:hypothetical protein
VLSDIRFILVHMKENDLGIKEVSGILYLSFTRLRPPPGLIFADE